MLVWVDGVNGMWLMFCRRQGIQAQRATPDPECELNITSFLALLHPSHCLIRAKNIMIIVLLLHVMWEMGRLGGASFMLGLGVGQGVVIIFLNFFFCFCAVVYFVVSV